MVDEKVVCQWQQPVIIKHTVARSSRCFHTLLVLCWNSALMPVTLLGCTDHQTHTTLQQQQQQQRRSGAESNNKERSGGVHCYRAAGSHYLRCPDSPTISIFLFHIQETACRPCRAIAAQSHFWTLIIAALEQSWNYYLLSVNLLRLYLNCC